MDPKINKISKMAHHNKSLIKLMKMHLIEIKFLFNSKQL